MSDKYSELKGLEFLKVSKSVQKCPKNILNLDKIGQIWTARSFVKLGKKRIWFEI